MKRRVLVCLMVTGLVAMGCAGKGSDSASTTSAAPGATTAPSTDDAKFGTLDSPCGEAEDGKVATVKADQAGKSADKLYIGVANDRSGIRPGLLKELWDSTNGFVAWCNEQGGINGLKLEAVDLDGHVVQVEAAMATACTDVFAIVGGGWAQDDAIFSGKDGADFHKCKMIAYPGFAVSTDLSEATDQVQALPNPSKLRPAAAFKALSTLYPEEVKKFGVVYGELPSIVQNKNQLIGVAKATEGFGTFGEISYDIISQDWALIAQQVLDKDLQAVSFVGEPPNMSKFSQALRDQGFKGIINADANQYDQRLLAASGPDAVEGIIVRFAGHPYEEADKWPATKEMIELLDKHVPDWERAGLANDSFTAALLFAKAAKQCAAEGEITRECVLKAGMEVHEWNGGGLTAQTDPGANEPAECAMLLQIKGGKFVRLYPELDSKEDNGEGFYCTDPVELSGEFGQGNTDSSILG